MRSLLSTVSSTRFKISWIHHGLIGLRRQRLQLLECQPRRHPHGGQRGAELMCGRREELVLHVLQLFEAVLLALGGGAPALRLLVEPGVAQHYADLRAEGLQELCRAGVEAAGA